MPIDYEVTAGDDGQAFYRWNKDEFGETYIAMWMWSPSQSILQQPANKDATESGGVRVPRQDASGSPPQTSNKLDESKPDEASDKLAFARWHDEVVETVNAQSINVRIEGSGSVFLSFEISATGELSDAKILRSSGSASLDKAALQMVEKARRVSMPPDRRATSFSMKLAFL